MTIKTACSLCLFTMLISALFSADVTLALPEDAEQPINVSYGPSEFFLDEGKQIVYRTDDFPAEITQGTLKITGDVITIESTDGEVRKITVIGSPARFQQQPAIDQALAIAEGGNIILDYDTQHLSIDEDARFSQDNNGQWTACHIDYFIDTKRLTTPTCENGEQAQVILPPRKDQ